MATIAQIRTALASALNTGVSNVQVSAYQLANPVAPGLQIGLGQSSFTQSMRGASGTGHMEREFIVEAFVPMSTDVSAQKALDTLNDMVASGSVNAAIELDPTLGGVVHHAVVTESSQPQAYVRETGSALWGCQFTVRVLHS